MKGHEPPKLVALLVLLCQLWSGTLWASHVTVESAALPGANWAETHDSGSHDRLVSHCDHCCHGQPYQLAPASSAIGTLEVSGVSLIEFTSTHVPSRATTPPLRPPAA